jgi:Cu(I)/Ag(I) efflux system periplasmic protein CusF
MQSPILRAAAVGIVALGLLGFPRSGSGQTTLVDGQIVKVDEPAKKITIRHGPFKKFDMEEPMTMVYAVQDPGMLMSVKPGDKVKFDADRVNGQFTVTKIEKAK